MDYEYADSVRKNSPALEIEKFKRLKKSSLIQGSIQSTRIEFFRDGKYEHRYNGVVNGGDYIFYSKKTMFVPYGILKSKSEDIYKIKKIKQGDLILESERFLFYLRKIEDEKLIANSKLPIADFTGKWTNKATRGTYDDLVDIEFTQNGKELIGKIRSENPKRNRVEKNLRGITGTVTGNLARINVKEYSNQSSYRYSNYKVELEMEENKFTWKTKEIRYEDKDGKEVYIKGSNNLPFPSETIFLRSE